MGCCNEPVSTLSGTPPDPSQHVNYARGMVLGVDDFVQEFSYLDGHTRWLAREAIGYGTVTGLHVQIDPDDAQGPRLHVRAGSALMPNGTLVCVPADQCALLDRWLAKAENAAVVTGLMNPFSPPSSPVSGPLTLYLTLCAAQCLTRPVPVPGEPCRSEDELMADSRVADDFKLDLRASAPPQVEDDALRDFVQWLRGSVTTGEGSPASPSEEADWMAALRQAAAPWLAAQDASPPLSPPAGIDTLGDYLADLSPPALHVAAGQMADFLRVAFRFWATELRPLWTAWRCQRTTTPGTADKPDGSACLLLAQLQFNVSWNSGSPGGVWTVAGGAPSVVVDETRRPVLTHARLLQEWMLAGGAVAGVAAGGTGVTTSPADGQLLIGSGGGYALGDLQGSANGVLVASAAGLITLSTPQDIAPVSRPRFAGLSTTGAVHVAFATVTVASPPLPIALDDSHHVVIADGGATLMLPKCAAQNLGRIYIVKSTGANATVTADAADAIDGPTNTPGLVKADNAKTFVSDGVSTWHVIATVA